MVMQAKYVLCAGFAVLGAVLLRDAFPAVLSFRQDPTPRKVEGFESQEEKLPHRAHVKRHSDHSLDIGSPATPASSFEQTSGWKEDLDEKLSALVAARDKVWESVPSKAELLKTAEKCVGGASCALAKQKKKAFVEDLRKGELLALITAEDEALGLFRLIKEFKEKQASRGEAMKEKDIVIPHDEATEAYNYAASKIQDYTKWYFNADNRETLAALNELRKALGFPAWGAQMLASVENLSDASPEPPKDAVDLPKNAADLEGWPEPGRRERLALKEEKEKALKAWKALDSDDWDYDSQREQFNQASAKVKKAEEEYDLWVIQGKKVEKLKTAGAGDDFIKLAELEQQWRAAFTEWMNARKTFGDFSQQAGALSSDVGEAHAAMEKQKKKMK